MHKKVFVLSLVSFLTVAICGNACAAANQGEPGPLQVRTVLIDTKGHQAGIATLTQLEAGVKVHVEAKGLKPGLHGFHFHEKGLCEPPEFKSAGEHLNPEHKQHGLLNPQGPHAGDLPNLVVDANGNATITIFTRLITLHPGAANSVLKEGGTTLVVHEKMDDEKTDPSGNSGARILCGVFKR